MSRDGGFGAGRSHGEPRKGNGPWRNDVSKDPRQGIGAGGEAIACRHLEVSGYEILQRNFRSRYGEIDIIARRRGIIAFIEVKTRIGSRFGKPFEAVSPRKQNQIRRMAEMWVAANAGVPEVRRCEFRFDVISVKLSSRDGMQESSLDHMEDAFR